MIKSSIYVRFNYRNRTMIIKYDSVKIILKRGETYTYRMINSLMRHPTNEFRKFNSDCIVLNSEWLILNLIIKDYHKTGGVRQ